MKGPARSLEKELKKKNQELIIVHLAFFEESRLPDSA